MFYNWPQKPFSFLFQGTCNQKLLHRKAPEATCNARHLVTYCGVRERGIGGSYGMHNND